MFILKSVSYVPVITYAKLKKIKTRYIKTLRGAVPLFQVKGAKYKHRLVCYRYLEGWKVIWATKLKAR